MIRQPRRTGALLLALLPGMAAASEPPAAPPVEPVFDCYAANSAWGLSYAGRMVDREGRIWSYRERGKSLPERSGDAGGSSYDANALRAKFAAATPGERLDATVLAEKIALIAKAALGKIETSDTGVRDAGTSTCHAYVREADGSRYRDVELGSDGGVGDRRTVNAAPEAQALIDWLRSVGVAK